MKKTILFAFIASFFVANTLAQTEILNGVWVLNEGVQDWNTGEMIVPASVGVYDPLTELYADVLVFEEADFTTSILIEGGFAYVGADNKIFKIDLDTYAVDAEVEVQGVRHLAYHDGLIYMTRGDVDPVTWASVEFDSYFLWFDAETLEQVGQLPYEEGVGFASEGVSIVDGQAYVAINNGFSWAQEVGIVGIYDIATGVYEEHDLGDDGKNPAHIKVVDGGVVTVNNTDWSTTSLSKVDLVDLGAESDTVSTQFVEGVAAGCNAAAILGDEILFQVSAELGMRRAATLDLTPVEGAWGPAELSYYRMATDPINGDVYATATNFAAETSGIVHILNGAGELVNTFEAGEVPGGIAFDVRLIQSVDEFGLDQNTIIGEYDLMGREWIEGSRGIKLAKMSDGSVVKSYEAR